MAKEYTELQLKAKEAGIKGWHLKLEKTLKAELAEIEAPEKITAVEVAEAFEEKEVVKEVAEPKVDAMGLLRVLKGRSWDQAMMGIKCLANKSDLWEYREIIKEEYAKSLQEK